MQAEKIRSFIFIFAAALLLLHSDQPVFSQSQTYPFKQFPIPRDLPNIERMFEDHFGYIWLGTAEGLYRFDGIDYTLYTSKDEYHGLRREVIKCMFEDDKLNFWVGAKSGLYRYDHRKRDFDKFSFSEEIYPQYVYQENDSTFLVLCSPGIYRFYPGSNRWEVFDSSLEGFEVYDMVCGRHNDLWMGTESKIRKYDLLKKTFHDYPLPVPSFAKPGEKISVSNMFLDSRERLWINTWYKGVVTIDTRTGATAIIDTVSRPGKSKILNIFVQSFVEDEAGNIWMANTDSGINIYHYRRDSISYLLEGTDFTFGLKGRDFILMSDQEKNIWVKSDLTLHYLARKNPIPILKSDRTVYLHDALTMKFIGTDYLLLGTYFGMCGINTETHKVTPLNDILELPSTHNAEFQATHDALIVGHKVWVSTPQGLRLLKWQQNQKDSPGFSFQGLFPIDKSIRPTKLFQLNDSLLLVKGRINTTGFATFNSWSRQFTYYHLQDSMMINDVIPFHKDTLLMAIRNKGLYYFTLQDQEWTMIPWKFTGDSIPMINPVFYKIVPLEDGSYALCSENYGLFLFDPASKTFRHINVAAIANTNRVFSIEEDQFSNLWVQVSNQLLHFNRTTGNLSKINLSNSFRGSTPHFFMKDGKGLFTVYDGDIYQIDPDQLFFKTQKPRLYLESIKARDTELSWSAVESIRLSFTDNFLTYNFTGLDFDNPEGVYYWYKIEEISEDWQFLGNKASISFGKLSPGNYHFMVKAVNDAGIWSEDLHAPAVRIQPPFWRTWWFALGMAILISSVIVYVNKLRRTKLETERKLRNQIARDLHDDIGSTLSGIKIFSVIASGMAAENMELSSLLQQIRDKSDLMMHSMSDIVWSINPAHDSLHDMMIRLKQYMAEVLESQDIEVHYSTPLDLKSLKVDLWHRKELYLVLKEIINNAAKYAACSQFYFAITKEKGEIIILARDNGKGMDEERITYGNGLKNIETRMNQIGATITRESGPGKGVKYELRIPILK